MLRGALWGVTWFLIVSGSIGVISQARAGIFEPAVDLLTGAFFLGLIMLFAWAARKARPGKSPVAGFLLSFLGIAALLGWLLGKLGY